MCNSNDYNHKTLTVDAINDSIVTHADAPVIGRTLKFLYAGWKRILGKTINLFGNAQQHLAV